jgi:hypothetical protein
MVNKYGQYRKFQSPSGNPNNNGLSMNQSMKTISCINQLGPSHLPSCLRKYNPPMNEQEIQDLRLYDQLRLRFIVYLAQMTTDWLIEEKISSNESPQDHRCLQLDRRTFSCSDNDHGRSNDDIRSPGHHDRSALF